MDSARAILLFCAFIALGATAPPPTYCCYGFEPCETARPLPAVRDRHLIRIPPQGACQLDDTQVDCSRIGAQLRAAYPDSNPQIGICPARDTSFARVMDVQRSLSTEHLFCAGLDCNPNSTDWLPQCKDLHASSGVDVRVLEDGGNCSVDRKQMRCEAVGAYLRNERHLPATQYVNVQVEGTGNSQARGRHIRDLIAKAGYTKIAVVGFVSEPHRNGHGTPQ